MRKLLRLVVPSLLVWCSIGIAPALASSNFPSIFNATYPASQSANNASCRLCHTSVTTQFNPYGRDFAVLIRSGMTEVDAFRALESSHSDTDPANTSNIAEINASAQPGWTAGFNNTFYSRSSLAVVATNQAPPATITGLLDPPTAVNSPPVADAGPNQTVRVGQSVTLDGSLSSDPDANPLTYAWSLTVPAGSTAVLSGATSVHPTFVPDAPGTYTAQLIVNDGTVNSAPATVTITVALWPVPWDLTGDRTSDVLWHKAMNGEVWLWPMSGATRLAEEFVQAVPDTNWEIRGQGDVSGDGKADLQWRNKVTGEIYVWPMNGSAPLDEIYVGSVSTDYDIAGTGDFNGDGKADLLWRNTTNGEVWVWLMDGATATAEVYVDHVDAGYAVKGVGDLDGDGKADIVWAGAAGDVWVWLMNGATRLDQVWVGTVPDTGYQIQGVADFDGNGKADLVWWHATRGEVWIWTMNGTTRTAETWVATVPETDYRIVATGDYDGDGKADLLWHHLTLGEVWVWLMDGTARLSETWIATVPDTSYQIVKAK